MQERGTVKFCSMEADRESATLEAGPCYEFQVSLGYLVSTDQLYLFILFYSF